MGKKTGPKIGSTKSDRGTGLYRMYPYTHPIHTNRFILMQGRVFAYSLDCDFPASEAGLMFFIDEIGPIPDGMTRPTVGRRDHTKGYVYGNFFWQEHSENMSERNVRFLTGRCVSPETKLKMSEAGKRIHPKDYMRKLTELRWRRS